MVEAMEIPKGFKKTEIGIIPDDWDVKKLSDIGESIIGLTYSPANVKSHGTLVLRSSNVQNGKLAFEDNVFVIMDLPKRVIVKENDILICVRNGSRQLIGKCALIDKKASGSAFGAFMSVYRSAFSLFAFHQFQSYSIQRQINETLGATINQITNKDLARFQIPLPPTKAEQTAIAEALNNADALITELEKLIAKKKAIKQGAMQALLKPKEGWETKKFGDLFELNPSKTQLKEEMVIFLGMEDVSEEGKIKNQHSLPISQIKKGLTFFKKNDVLVAKITPCFENGKGACLDTLRTEHGFGSTEFHVLRTNEKSISRFVFYHTQTRQFRKQLEAEMTGTAGQKRVPAKSIANYYISVPPIEIQNSIAQILSNMDTEIEALEKKLDKYKMLKQGMMQNLLTGRVRLI